MFFIDIQLVNIILISFASLLTVIYLYFKHSYSYWESKGVPHIKPSFPFGNLNEFGKNLHTSELTQFFYKKFKNVSKLCGIYIFGRKIALITDLELVKKILITDFHNFNDRGLYHNEKHDPLSSTLFSLEGKKWKDLRAKLTSTFTSGKMKFMFPTVVEVGDRFRECLLKLVEKHDEMNIKELLARFTTDIIGTCAFGIECNSLNDPNAEFRQMGALILEKPRHGKLIFQIIHEFRSIARLLRVKVIRSDATTFFLKVVRDTVEYREKNNIQRNDFMDLMIKLKKDDHKNNNKSEDKLTISQIAAQAYTFFLAGFETSSTTLTFCLYCYNMKYYLAGPKFDALTLICFFLAMNWLKDQKYKQKLEKKSKML